MVKISFIIVNFNTSDLLIKCIGNLLGIHKNMEIIVVDNGSTDGSADRIEKKYGKKITLIRTKNKGISAGNNLGIKKSSGDYLIYVGTDAFPRQDALKKLIKYMDESSDVGIVTPKLVLRDGTTDLHAHRGFPTPWNSMAHFLSLNKMFPKSKLFNQYYMEYEDLNTAHEIDLCISHFMVMKKEVINKIGKWDENFWVYGEDVDICYRTKEAGYKIMYLGNVEVLHYKGAGVGRKETADLSNASRDSKESMKKLARSTSSVMRMFYKKHLSKKYPFFVNWAAYIAIFVMSKIRILMSSSK